MGTNPATVCIDNGQNRKLGYAYTKRNGRTVSVHRLVYCDAHGLDIGQIEGLVVRHSCDNNRCVNKDHLLLGTQLDNMRDMHERARHPGTVHKGNYQTIRDEYVRGSKEFGQAALAAKYGLSQTHVSRIINN